MGKLIDKDALPEHKFPENQCNRFGDGAYYRQGWNDAIDAIVENAPTVDAVPVVRCKDCEWWTRQDKSLQGRCARYGTYPTGEWFCAAGRKDGDHE